MAKFERKQQALIAEEAISGTAETLNGTDDAITCIVGASLEPEPARYEVDVATDTAIQSGDLVGTRPQMFEFQTFLIGNREGSRNDAIRTFQIGGYSKQTTVKKVEVSADETGFEYGETIGNGSETGVILHNGTLELDSKYWLFYTGDDFTLGDTITGVTSGETATASASSAGGSILLEAESDASSQKTFTCGLWDDGVLKSTYGAMAEVEIQLEPKKVAIATIRPKGIYSAPVEQVAYTITNEKPEDAPKFCKADATFGTEVPKFSTLSLNLGQTVYSRENANATNGECLEPSLVTVFSPRITINKEVGSASQTIADYAYWTTAQTDNNFYFQLGNESDNAFFFIGEACQIKTYSKSPEEGLKRREVELQPTNGLKILVIG